jgi:signal transduction histidine kinase
VIIADHFITGRPITADRIQALESFASQESLAIEHSRLYMDMERKIKELESVTDQLQKNTDLLVAAERYSAVGHVAAQLAHNIRNPITSIGGTARLLARKTSDPDWLKFLTMMTAEAEKIEGILEDLFSFVKTVQPDFKHTAIGPVISKTLLLHSAVFREKGIKATFTQPDADPHLFLDAKLIQAALAHLIKNSIDAMPDGGELSIWLEVKEDMVQIFLEDSGIGIQESSLEQITDPFFTTKTAGAGLGLSLVNQIIEDHHGNLEIMAGEETGARVVISLPF